MKTLIFCAARVSGLLTWMKSAVKPLVLASISLFALWLPAVGSAAEITDVPSAEATRYSWVVVDSRKLRVPLGVALA
ncbi:MAG: hypothetical protein E6Q88_03645 [Lysobacteraceae bacterium]|nr:MAG: hypothetical protein E6Q88_03645 [Xanthomonadaceae bacterium]